MCKNIKKYIWPSIIFIYVKFEGNLVVYNTYNIPLSYFTNLYFHIAFYCDWKCILLPRASLFTTYI